MADSCTGGRKGADSRSSSRFRCVSFWHGIRGCFSSFFFLGLLYVFRNFASTIKCDVSALSLWQSALLDLDIRGLVGRLFCISSYCISSCSSRRRSFGNLSCVGMCICIMGGVIGRCFVLLFHGYSGERMW
ncbi:hypothetical protein V8C26DRAFT_158904 [Trichoderma gracile]